MSENSDRLCAKVAVKVPQPDSLVEVRVTPPDSNFEVKVLPSEEVIELTIRPVGSLIEVRIGPTGIEADSAVGGTREVLDQTAEIEEAEPAEAGEPLVITAHPGELPPELDPADPAFKLPDETLKLLVDEEGDKINPSQVEAMADPSRGYAEEEAPEAAETPDEAPAVDEAPEAAETPDEAPAEDEAPEAAETPDEAPAEEEAPEAAETPDEAPAVEGAPEAVGLEGGSAGPAARAALARLSAAFSEDLADNVPAANSPAPDVPAPLTEEEDLAPVARQDKELAVGPIDVQKPDAVDTEKSHGTPIKAKPMVKAASSGTIVPVS